MTAHAEEHFAGSNRLFVSIWVWLVVSVLNGLYGHIRVGIPVVNEIGAFIPIFGIPAALAWYLAYRHADGAA